MSCSLTSLDLQVEGKKLQAVYGKEEQQGQVAPKVTVTDGSVFLLLMILGQFRIEEWVKVNRFK